ncbi:MAG: TolC family protein [Acidobacteriota bacterium]
MHTPGRLTIGVVAGLVLALAAPAGAQQPSHSADKSRVSDLIQYALRTYQQAQVPAPAPPAESGQQPPLIPQRPVVRLTVEEAAARALENNIELSVERLNPQLQDLAIAQVRAAYRPTLTSTVSKNSNNPLPTSQLNGGTTVTNSTANFNGGFSQAIPWFGGSLSASWNNSRTDTTSTFSTRNPQFQSIVSFNYTQPLLRNFRIDSTRSSLQTSLITREISDITLRTRVITTLANTRNAYWDLVHAIRAVEAARRSLSLAEKLVEDNKIRVEVGTLAPMDIVQAQAEAAARRQTLASAEATRLTTELTLKRLIVSSTGDPLWNAEIDPVDQVAIEPKPIDLPGAVANALDRRTDLQQARRQIDSNDLNIRYLRNQMMPGVDLSVNYGLRGLGGPEIVRGGLGGSANQIIPGGYLDALRTMGSFDYPNWTLSLNFSYPIGQSSADASYARARMQYQQAQAQLKALELQVATEVTNAALTVQSGLRRLEAAQASRQLAESRLEAEQSKFEVGMSTNFFVVQAQRDLLDAQISELRASLDYRRALVDFERVQETSASGGGSSVTSVSR